MTVTTRSVVTQTVTERTRKLLTLLNFYYAGVGLLVLINLYLLAHMAFAWRAANSQNADALAQQTVALKTAEIQVKPLEGLDAKLAQATTDADKFSKQRLPFAYSQFLGEIGALTKKQGVKLTRVQYADPVKVMDGTAGALTEIRMDAGLSGDYRPLVLFINSLERDKMFFLISGVTLTGQQSGTVGLRLRLTTYLRPPFGSEGTEKAVHATADGSAPASASAGEGGPR